MRKDFDFVTFKDYESDMRESARNASAAINFVRARAEEAERQYQEAKMLIAELVIAAGGKITIPDRNYWRNSELTQWRNDDDMTIMFEAKRRPA